MNDKFIDFLVMLGENITSGTSWIFIALSPSIIGAFIGVLIYFEMARSTLGLIIVKTRFDYGEYVDGPRLFA